MTGRSALLRAAIAALAAAICTTAGAGEQKYEPLSASVQAALQRTVADRASPGPAFTTEAEANAWMKAMAPRLSAYVADPVVRDELLATVHYEAVRAGLDPQMVLGVIEVESKFRKFAVSRAGARGYMQVMPFWTRLIGSADHNLFNLRTNLRYGCTILRHYLDVEKGDTFRALGRYNGTLGQARYPQKVQRAWNRNWSYEGPRIIVTPMKYMGDG